jgi:hypothetical protein
LALPLDLKGVMLIDAPLPSSSMMESLDVIADFFTDPQQLI